MENHGQHPNRMDLFTQCRNIPADMAARALGVFIHHGGGRGWALCPLHEEHKASMMFDKAGRWHCFSCGRGGDAVDLWAAVKGMAPADAAAELGEKMGRAKTWERK